MQSKTDNQRFKEIRSRLNLSQKEMAESLDVAKGHISAIEQGIRSVSKKIEKQLLEKFNVSPEYLREGIGEIFNTNIHNDVYGNVHQNVHLSKKNKEKGRILTPDEIKETIIEFTALLKKMEPGGEENEAYRLLREEVKKESPKLYIQTIQLHTEYVLKYQTKDSVLLKLLDIGEYIYNLNALISEIDENIRGKMELVIFQIIAKSIEKNAGFKEMDNIVKKLQPISTLLDEIKDFTLKSVKEVIKIYPEYEKFDIDANVDRIINDSKEHKE